MGARMPGFSRRGSQGVWSPGLAQLAEQSTRRPGSACLAQGRSANSSLFQLSHFLNERSGLDEPL